MVLIDVCYICMLLHAKHHIADKKTFSADVGMPLLAPDPDSGHGDVGAHAARVEEVPRRHNRQGAVDGQKEDADQPVEEIYKDDFTPNAKKERRRRSKRREEEGICN